MVRIEKLLLREEIGGDCYPKAGLYSVAMEGYLYYE